MSHVDTIRAYYDAVDAGDVDALLDLFTDDTTYLRPGYEPIVGRAAMEHFYRDVRVIDSGRHSLDAVLVDGDLAACHGTFSGTLKDGSAAREGFADFFELRDGRIAVRRTYFDRAAV